MSDEERQERLAEIASGGICVPVAPPFFDRLVQDPRKAKIDRMRGAVDEALPLGIGLSNEDVDQLVEELTDAYDPTVTLEDLMPSLGAHRGSINFVTPPASFDEPTIARLRRKARLWRDRRWPVRKWRSTRSRVRRFRAKVRDARDGWKGRQVCTWEDEYDEYGELDR